MRAEACRRPVYKSFVALGVLGLILGSMATGCGSGSSAVRPANAPVTRAEASHFAEEVSLRQADVPYLAEEKGQSITIPVHRYIHVHSQLAHCAGTMNSADHLVNVLAFPSFRGKVSRLQAAFVKSGATIWSRPRFAEMQNTVDTRRGRRCFARFLQRFIPPGLPAVVSPVEFVPPPVPNIGATETRMGISSSVMGARVYIDGMRFICGPAEVEIVVGGKAEPLLGQPLFEKRLLLTLYNRARTSDLIARVSGSGQGCQSDQPPVQRSAFERRGKAN
jgi:hypothetical protein